MIWPGPATAAAFQRRAGGSMPAKRRPAAPEQDILPRRVQVEPPFLFRPVNPGLASGKVGREGLADFFEESIAEAPAWRLASIKIIGSL